MGIDPGPLTLAELFAMHRGRCRQDAQQTASILAMLANCNRDPKKHRPYRITDFLPPEFARELKDSQGGTSPAELRRLKPFFQGK